VVRWVADLGEAKKEAAIVAERLNAGQGDALELTGKDRDAYLHAVRKLRPLGIGLVPAIDEYPNSTDIQQEADRTTFRFHEPFDSSHSAPAHRATARRHHRPNFSSSTAQRAR
jgi:hypothetical protein